MEILLNTFIFYTTVWGMYGEGSIWYSYYILNKVVWVVSLYRKEFEEHNQYKQRCNAFFMDLVSRLCFCGTIPPEKVVIKKLMAYVICEHKMAAGGEQVKKTGHLALFKESIDPTPVVRSFLLQLLLKSKYVVCI